jgi:hypothetical protein
LLYVGSLCLYHGDDMNRWSDADVARYNRRAENDRNDVRVNKESIDDQPYIAYRNAKTGHLIMRVFAGFQPPEEGAEVREDERADEEALVEELES